MKLFYPNYQLIIFYKSLLGSVACKNCAKKSQNCRVIQNHDEGLKKGLKKQCIVGL